MLSFFLVELDTTGAIDGSDRLLLRGRFPPKVIESGLRKYIGTWSAPGGMLIANVPAFMVAVMHMCLVCR